MHLLMPFLNISWFWFYVYACLVFIVCLHTLYMQCQHRPEEDSRSSGSRITDSCELLCEYWEQTLGLLEEQHVHLTTEIFLQLFLRCLYVWHYMCAHGRYGNIHVQVCMQRLILVIYLDCSSNLLFWGRFS